MAESYTLLKKQKNDVFKILQQAGLEPADFSWHSIRSEATREGIVSKLLYRDPQFFFQFDYYYGGSIFLPLFTPASDKRIERPVRAVWGRVLDYVKDWAGALKLEIDLPDMWQEIDKYRATFSLSPPVELVNEPIPGYEADEIASKVQLLVDKIEESFQLQDEQQQFVNSKLTYLADAAKRQGRLDWVHTFIGVIVTIAMALSLAPDEANRLWALVKEFLGQFVYLIGPG